MLWWPVVAAAIVVDRAFKRAKIDADAVGMVAIARWRHRRRQDLACARSPAGIQGDWLAGFVGQRRICLVWRARFRHIGAGVHGLARRSGRCGCWTCAAPAAAIGYGIGRIGCFLSGDGCYGIEIKPVHLLGFTFHPWGMAFPHGIEPVFVPVYPTPLYELAAGLLIGGSCGGGWASRTRRAQFWANTWR